MMFHALTYELRFTFITKKLMLQSKDCISMVLEEFKYYYIYYYIFYAKTVSIQSHIVTLILLCFAIIVLCELIAFLVA